MNGWIFAWSALGPVISLILAYPICLKLKDNSLVDIGWALGFVSVAWISFLINGFQQNSWSLRQIIITSLVTVWGIRLLTYIVVRKIIRGNKEDKRFARYREEWKTNIALKSFLILFIPQMILVYIISAPVMVVNSVMDQPLEILDIVVLVIGGIIWVIGFFFETTADIQLLRFTSNPENKGKTLNSGLWRYSRHPNYFGETTQWWGIFIMMISLGVQPNELGLATTILAWISILGPILLTFLLLKVSGVGLLEETVLKNRDGYKEYMETTSAFIPWFPKKPKEEKPSD
ncbi:MAG: DUF1295 domain-containing protein [Candidatus Heimdallarchaeota archaeon]|nr:DUF1295 domain-containing protein [Candidatus Heimdallarchaeota archaeon]